MADDPLVRSPLLAGLAPDARREVVKRAEVRDAPRGRAVFRQDEPALHLHLVEAGRLKLSQTTAEGAEVIVRMAGPGDVVAAIAVLDGKAYPFTATAVEPARLLLWTRATLLDLFRRVPSLEANVLAVVGTHTRDVLDRFRELATEPVPQRLARTLLRLLPEGGDRIERITRQELAAMAATTLYTVSRVLSEWQSRGILEGGRGRIVVRSRQRLAALAGVS